MPSPTVAPATGSERRIAILFAECDGYGALCQDLTPTQVHEHLEALYAILVDAIVGAGGVLDKFLGDGAMALFGAPAARTPEECARSALAAARAMLAGVDAAVASGRLRPTVLRAGAHLGDVWVGIQGAGARVEYTAVGHAVNVAARLCGASGREGTTLLVSDELVAALGAAAPANLASAGTLALKGVRVPVGAWRRV